MRYWLFWVAAFAGTMLLVAGAEAEPSPLGQDCTGQQGVPWDQQIKSCTALIESGQGNANDRALAYKNRGNAYLGQGDDDRAMIDYNEAIRLDPKFALAYNDRGSVYIDKEDPDHAIVEFDEAIRLDPKLVLAYAGRAAAYAQKGDFGRALPDASEAIRLDPKSAYAYERRGDVYTAEGDFDRAIADYNAAIRLDPKSDEAYNDLGSAYLYKGDFDPAIAHFSEAIQIDPENESAYFNRGRANFYADAIAKALADFKQANTLDPRYAYAALWIDIAEARSKMPSSLPQAIAKVDMTAWPAPVIRMFLGQMAAAAVLAAADDANAAKKAGQVCEANFYSGEWALRQGAKDEAARRFQLAASDCPTTLVERYAAEKELKALAATP